MNLTSPFENFLSLTHGLIEFTIAYLEYLEIKLIKVQINSKQVAYYPGWTQVSLYCKYSVSILPLDSVEDQLSVYVENLHLGLGSLSSYRYF